MSSTSPPPAVGQQYLDDLQKLVDYYLERPPADVVPDDAELRFAVSLARYRLANQKLGVLHQRKQVLVFGGAGAGKSTVSNILIGSGQAEVNPQAGYTRHPIGFTASSDDPSASPWPTLLGPLRRRDDAEPANLDENVYGHRAIPPGDTDADDGVFLRRHVVWDGPDLTTKDAEDYESRVIEIAGLAHVGVYVASDERYNDELPTKFLKMFLHAGKPVVVVLTKCGASDADELEELFRDQVLAHLPHAEAIKSIVVVPAPPTGPVSQLWQHDSGYSKKIRDAITQAAGDFVQLTHHARQSAITFLSDRQTKLLEPLRKDLSEWQTWMELVRQKSNDAVLRYQREFLQRVQYPELNQAKEWLLDALALSGPLFWLGRGLDYARAPYRFVREWGLRLAQPAEDTEGEEDRSLNKARQAMLEELRVAAASRRERHHLWPALHQSLREQAQTLIEPAYREARDRQTRQFAQRLSSATTSVTEEIRQKPFLMPLLQGLRVLVDLLAIGGSVALGGFSIWSLVLIPLSLGVVDECVRFVAHRYVQRFRAGLVRQQKEHAREVIQSAYIDQLLQLPKPLGAKLYELANLADRLTNHLDQLTRTAAEDEAA